MGAIKDPELQNLQDSSAFASEVSEGRLVTEQMLLNVGPQHPATHGVFRLLATIDGERIVRAEPVVGLSLIHI